MDAKRRQLERQALSGDPRAEEKLKVMDVRLYGTPWDHLIGEEVFVFGARKNFRGLLLAVNQQHLVMGSLWEVDVSHADQDPEQEERWPQVTEHAPAVIPPGTYQLVARYRAK